MTTMYLSLADLNLSNTDAEGRVAVGGNATLSNYGVGAGITPLPPANTDPSFVVDGSVDVTGAPMPAATR